MLHSRPAWLSPQDLSAGRGNGPEQKSTVPHPPSCLPALKSCGLKHVGPLCKHVISPTLAAQRLLLMRERPTQAQQRLSPQDLSTWGGISAPILFMINLKYIIFIITIFSITTEQLTTVYNFAQFTNFKELSN